LVGYLGLVFLMGGGARGDILSLVILRPVAIIVCGFALMTLGWKHIRQYRFLFALAAALFVLVGLHLVPLPFSIWASLPGRGIIVEIGQAAQLGEVWRPLTMVPIATWNAFYSLFVPLAALLLAVQLDREEQHQLLPVLILLGGASGLLGILQVIGAQEGPFYLYRVTNYSSAVGLFSNRNHQALFLACLIPMLATYASSGIKTPEQARFRGGIAIAGSIVLVPLLLVAGSRTGLALGVLGLLVVPLLYRRPAAVDPAARRPARWPMITLMLGGVAIIALALVTVLFGRDEAISRVIAPSGPDEARFQVWGPIMDMAWQYFPFGSGIGTFVEAYKIGETDALLSSTYLNHAHNDWIEVYMTGGAIGLLLLAAATVAWAVRSFRIWSGGRLTARQMSFGRLSSVLILMLGLASIGDYPLRVPSLACLAVILAVWLAGEGRPDASASKQVEV
jgi:O-antigen ligase